MSLASNLARSIKVELIAKLASSYEAYDGGTVIKNVAPHNVRDYFRKYGSTARKFDQNSDGDVYTGYVRISGKPEFLSAIVLAGQHAIAVSFDSETDESNDFLTLMAKKEFADRINAAVERAAAYMRQSIAPAPTSPSPVPPTSPVIPKKDHTVWWMLGIGAAALVAAALFVQDYLNRVNQPQPSMTGFALQDSYDVGASEIPPHVRDFSPPNYSAPAPVLQVPPYEASDGVQRRANSLSPDQKAATERWLVENEICRGSSSEDLEVACAKRDATGRELNAAGLCYGHDEDRGGVDFFWHVCEAGSHR